MHVSWILLYHAVTPVAAQHVYTQPAFDVVNSTNITYAQALRCNPDQKTGCKAMDLQLEVYQPITRAGGPAVPGLKPAYILAHGGGNSGGDKEQYCFQGAAAFHASRGFVGFNIDYRLAHDYGLLPSANSQWPAEGARLISHVQRNDDRFWPHPEKSDQSDAPDPHDDVLQLGTEQGELSGLCIAVESDGKSLSLQKCNNSDASQVWHMDKFTINKQTIKHAASGKCLDIPSASTAAKANLPVEVAACVASPASSSTQLWQVGYSGALITRGATMSVQASRDGLLGWNPKWQSGYPAVRDCKAAVRFVRANAEKYGVDPDRIVVSGGSAGATDMLAVGATFDADYKDEISIDEDPTLSSTHLDFSSKVQCVVPHWASDGEIQLVQQHDPKNASRYSKDNAPVVSFHGDVDTTIPIAHARAVQAEYVKNGVDYELHVLTGCGHGSWCYDGNGSCGCTNGVQGYGDLMDVTALPFVAKHLNLELIDSQSVIV